MLKPFSLIFFMLVMIWTGSIFLTSSPSARVERACVPVTVADKVVVAIVQLLHEPWAFDAHQGMLNFEYGCQFTVWKTFYEEALEKPVQGKGGAPNKAPAIPEALPQTQHVAPQKQPVEPSEPNGFVEVPVNAPSRKVSPEKPANDIPEPVKPMPSYLDTK